MMMESDTSCAHLHNLLFEFGHVLLRVVVNGGEMDRVAEVGRDIHQAARLQLYNDTVRRERRTGPKSHGALHVYSFPLV